MRKTCAFWGGSIVALAVLGLGAIRFHRLSVGGDPSNPPDAAGAGAVPSIIGGQERVAGSGAVRLVAVEGARIERAGIDGTSGGIGQSDLLAVADVGSAYLAAMESRGATGKGEAEESQSDAEMANVMPEPVHAVAPVPTQEAGLAAMKVKLARVGGENGREVVADVANVIESSPDLGIGIESLGNLVSDDSALSLHDQIELRVAMGWAMLGQARYRESASQWAAGLRIALRYAMKTDW